MPSDGMFRVLGLRSAVVATVSAIPTAIIAIISVDTFILKAPVV